MGLGRLGLGLGAPGRPPLWWMLGSGLWLGALPPLVVVKP